MNTRKIIFWASFTLVLVLIIWGLSVSLRQGVTVDGVKIGTVPPISAIDHILGEEKAPITIIEYSDFQCPGCQSYFYFVEKLLEESSSTIRFAYRHYPLPQHSNAMISAIASEAAGVQGRFFEMYRLIFRNHADWETLADPKDVFMGYAKEIGINVAQFTDDLASTTLKDKVNNDLKGGQIAGINQTPTFFVNGKIIQLPSKYADFKKLIDDTASGSTD